MGPNNSGKTNFVRIVAMLREIMLGKEAILNKNLFSDNPIVEISVSFLEDGSEYLFEIKYDVSKKEYVYERFACIERDKYKNVKINDLLIRDISGRSFYSEDRELITVMKVAARSNILIYLVDTDEFPCLKPGSVKFTLK